MKKIVIYSILTLMFITGYNYAEAIAAKASDYQVVKTSEKSDISTVYETSQIKIVKQDNYEYPFLVRIMYGPYEYVKEDF